MSLQVNKWSLEIKGVKLSPKYFLQQFLHERMGMKVLTLVTLAMTIYNLLYVIVLYSSDKALGRKIMFTIIPDLSSFVVMVVFYILLPRRSISFPGMGCIPMCILILLEVEFNVAAYDDYSEVSGFFMTLVFFCNFNNFIIEQKFMLIVPVNVLMALYTGIRVILAYNARGLPSYVVGSLYFCVQGYVMMRTRRELIAEKYNTKANSKKWKHVLDISQDAVVVCDSTRVLYYNDALTSILSINSTTTGNTAKDIDTMFEDTQISSQDGKYIAWTNMLNTVSSLPEQKYLVHDRSRTLKFIIDKRTVVFKGKEASLLFIRDSSFLEQTHVKVTETKYSHLLVSTITHDLKSPITAIQGNLAILPPYVSEKGSIYLKAAQLAAQCFEYYIYDLVDFSQILEGAFNLAKDFVDPLELIEKAKAMVIPKAEIKGLKCEVLTEKGLPREFVGDLRRTLQVVLNLAFNSIKYTFKGGIVIRFWHEKEISQLCFEVKDTGIGIIPEDLERINKLFGLLDKKSVYNETGIGLGITISKNIVNSMNGTLKIVSKVGVGTTCTVKIPLNPTGPSKRFSAATLNTIVIKQKGSFAPAPIVTEERLLPAASAMLPDNQPKVIVVDDEPFIQLALGTLLTRLGCKVDKASNGQMGVEMVNEKVAKGDPYDLIFMDANMPVMSGYEAARVIKQNPQAVAPIICVSAQDSAQHQAMCKECGMSDVVSKPCTINKLKEILVKYNFL